MKIQQINISGFSNDLDQAFNARAHLLCEFCGKSTTISPLSRILVDKLSKKNLDFCSFCIRNDLTSRNNRHTLILSFRSVFGYLYYHDYKIKKKTLFFSQLEDLISSHEKAGLTNPVFKYDPETFLWFINFEKVGATGRKIPVVEVHKTILNILACFNLYETVTNFRLHLFYKKYAEAIDDFYKKRSRPVGKTILSPTFHQCGVIETKDLPLEKTREFNPKDMVK